MIGIESELVRRCLGGDPAAFEALYEARAGGVLAYLRRSGFSPADADDLTQEVFTRVLKSLRTFDARKGRLSQWIASIARNVARRHWHRRGRDENFDPELAELTLAAPDDPAETSEAREEMDALRECIAALPPDYALLVRMRYVEALTTRGIACSADMPEATVRLRLKEAHAMLERCLKGKGVVE